MEIDVFLLTSEFPPHVGGIASHVEELSRFLSPLVRKVTVVNPVALWSPPLPVSRHGVAVCRPEVIKLQPIYQIMLRRWLARTLPGTPGTVLHVHGIRPLAATRGIPAPTVFTNHSSGFLRRLEASPSRQQRTARLLDHVARLIAPSDELVAAARTLSYRGPATMIPNGVDPERFRPGGDSSLRSQWGIGPEEVVLLLARRLVEKNGVIWFARALPLLRHLPFRAVIAGDGVERAAMTAELAAANLLDRVCFLGAVANAEMPSIYAAADIAVLPSLAEATSIAGLEAMASGLPLVGTEVGGIPALIDHGKTGCLVAPRDAGALANVLGPLIIDGEARRRFGAAARAKVEREFAWPIIAKHTLAVYQACFEGPLPLHSSGMQ